MIVEDHVALRTAMESLLDGQGFNVVGATADGDDAVHMIRKQLPDVAIVNVGLPNQSGIDLAKTVLAGHPDAAILLYTESDEAMMLADALDSGARGLALKSERHDHLLIAIRTVADGGTYVDPTLAKRAIETSRDRLQLLSKRERDILELLAEGLNGAEVARRLYLSPETIRTHIRNAMRKLEARTRTHAVALAVGSRRSGSDWN